MIWLEGKISLYEIVKIVKKRMFLILSCLLLVVAVTWAISYFFITPQYDANAQILINQKVVQDQQLSTQDIQTNLQLINTYTVIIKSPVILSIVIERLKLNTTPDLLMEKIAMSSEQNSQVLNISVKDISQKKAVSIANMTAEVFQEKISELMNVDNVTILSPATVKNKEKPIIPNIPLNLAIATFLGFIIGVSISLLIEFLDTTVKTEKDVQDIMNFPLLGLISPISTKRVKKYKGQTVKGEREVV